MHNGAGGSVVTCAGLLQLKTCGRSALLLRCRGAQQRSLHLFATLYGSACCCHPVHCLDLSTAIWFSEGAFHDRADMLRMVQASACTIGAARRACGMLHAANACASIASHVPDTYPGEYNLRDCSFIKASRADLAWIHVKYPGPCVSMQPTLTPSECSLHWEHLAASLHAHGPHNSFITFRVLLFMSAASALFVPQCNSRLL